MKKLIAAAFMIISAYVASADATWCQFSFYSPGDIMLPWARSDVYGLRLDFPYGNNKGCLIGADIGVVGLLGERMTGFQFTGFNLVDLASVKGLQFGAIANRDKDFHGVQISGIVNWNEDESAGVQIGTVNYGGEFTGFQIGGVSWMVGNLSGVSFDAMLTTRSKFTGWSIAGFNYGLRDVSGAQMGGINVSAETSTGLQLGLVNFAKHHEGLQLGLVNINSSGFLPCFPFVNFNFSR
ncbi:MAG: hypothetical protein IJG18_00280 [Kiritimatiellae bacterium]|nr:hypothetical protein [Kiritimatiellia bacterium]